MTDKDKKSLDHRRDTRSVEEFTQDIKRGTDKEKLGASLLKSDIEERGFKVEVKDNGMDNSGELITDAKKVNANPDYIFLINDKETKIEFKIHTEKFPCITFKEIDLKRYLKCKALIVIVRENYWYKITSEAIDFILKNFKSQIYDRFSPNDLAIRLYSKDIDLISKKNTDDKKYYIQKLNWFPNTLEKVKGYHKELFER